MSLDITLTARRTTEVYSSNITHNLTDMAKEAGIYEHLWRPEEIGITHANQLIEPLTIGLTLMRTYPAKFKAYDAVNGWGVYEDFVIFVENYLLACHQNPDAEIYVSR